MRFWPTSAIVYAILAVGLPGVMRAVALIMVAASLAMVARAETTAQSSA
jgi:hypothetical protein